MPLPINEPEIQRDDGTPMLAKQCDGRGWQFGFYNFGKGEQDGRTFFNPGLVQRPDGLWLLTRVSEIMDASFGLNSIVAFKLDASGATPEMGKRLTWPEAEANEQHEDARAVYFPLLDQVAVCCTNFRWYGHGQSPSWSGAKQVLGFFDSEWQCKIKHRPPIGGNPPEFRNIGPKEYEKSWMPFFQENKLHIFYSAKPWRIFRFGQTWRDFEGFEHKEGVSWRYGPIRNGTPPLLLDGRYISFFHSSLPWRGNYRRYYMGAITFESEPPFKPIAITPEPMLLGSQQDPWQLRKPPCVFPCGAIQQDSDFLITMGVNDVRAAWCRIPMRDIDALLAPCAETIGDAIFPQNGLSKEEMKKEKLRDNARRAREALAAKRARGEINTKAGRVRGRRARRVRASSR